MDGLGAQLHHQIIAEIKAGQAFLEKTTGLRARVQREDLWNSVEKAIKAGGKIVVVAMSERDIQSLIDDKPIDQRKLIDNIFIFQDVSGQVCCVDDLKAESSQVSVIDFEGKKIARVQDLLSLSERRDACHHIYGAKYLITTIDPRDFIRTLLERGYSNSLI